MTQLCARKMIHTENTTWPAATTVMEWKTLGGHVKTGQFAPTWKRRYRIDFEVLF